MEILDCIFNEGIEQQQSTICETDCFSPALWLIGYFQILHFNIYFNPIKCRGSKYLIIRLIFNDKRWMNGWMMVNFSPQNNTNLTAEVNILI